MINQKKKALLSGAEKAISIEYVPPAFEIIKKEIQEAKEKREAKLVSPGVSVTIIDGSEFIPSHKPIEIYDPLSVVEDFFFQRQIFMQAEIANGPRFGVNGYMTRLEAINVEHDAGYFYCPYIPLQGSE